MYEETIKEGFSSLPFFPKKNERIRQLFRYCSGGLLNPLNVNEHLQGEK